MAAVASIIMQQQALALNRAQSFENERNRDWGRRRSGGGGGGVFRNADRPSHRHHDNEERVFTPPVPPPRAPPAALLAPPVFTRDDDETLLRVVDERSVDELVGHVRDLRPGYTAACCLNSATFGRVARHGHFYT